jgi:thiaminase
VLTISRGHFIEYLLQRKDVTGPWKEHTEHDFVQKMANGTLPVENFKVYLIQDYLFLVSQLSTVLYFAQKVQIQFSRAHALAAYKAKSLEDTNRVRLSNIQGG